MNIEWVPINKLKPNEKNRNRHTDEQIERLAAIIKYQGWRWPIIADKQNTIWAGHGRWMAAEKLELKEVPVELQEFTSEEQAYAFLVSDNAIAAWAELDLSGINSDIETLGPDFDINLLGINGFTVEPLDKLEPGCDEDEVPEHVEPRTKLGDIYKLGHHRLMCGSSTSIDNIQLLFGTEKCDLVFTSPPYNVGKTPNGNDNKYITYQDSQSSQEYLELLFDFTTNYLTVSDYVFTNIQSVAGNKIALIEYLYKMRDNYADTIIWDKETSEPAMARRVLNSQFEYIHIFSNEAKRSIGRKDFRGTITNVFRLNSRAGKEFSNIHKATFRVEFPEYFINNFVESSVADPFAGTGTTLIAAEKCGVKSFNMELDPKYCDVIISRWEKYTNKKAELING